MFYYILKIENDDSNSNELENEIKELVNDYFLNKNLAASCCVLEKTFLSLHCRHESGVLKKIRQENIIFIEKFRHKVILYTHLGSFEIYSSLKKLESKLDPSIFFRVHQGYIVNINEIKMLYATELSLLSSDRMIPVSRRHRSKLKAEFFYS